MRPTADVDDLNAPHEADLELDGLQRLADGYFVLLEAGDMELLDDLARD
jgi:hypothetical protein